MISGFCSFLDLLQKRLIKFSFSGHRVSSTGRYFRLQRLALFNLRYHSHSSFGRKKKFMDFRKSRIGRSCIDKIRFQCNTDLPLVSLHCNFFSSGISIHLFGLLKPFFLSALLDFFFLQLSVFIKKIIYYLLRACVQLKKKKKINV